MSDTIYRVVLDLSVRGDLAAKVGGLGQAADSARPKLRGVSDEGKRMADTLSSAGEKVGGIMESMADKAIGVAEGIAKWGAIAAVGALTYGVMGLNNQLEQTQISLGAIANAQGFAKTFDEGFKQAGEQVAKMKQDVKTLPGDLGQLSNLMKTIATPAGQGGANLDQIRALAGKAMLTGAILSVPQEVVAREMAQLLAGRAGAHNILGTRLGLVGDDAKKFNAMAPEARLKRINLEMNKYQGAADKFGQSFVANWTTLKDNIKYVLLAPVTAPLFEHVKVTIVKINKYFDDHKDKIKQMVQLVGDHLAEAWDKGVSVVERFGSKIESIASSIAKLDPSQVIEKFVHLAEVVGSIKLAGIGISGVSGVLGAIGRRAETGGGGIGGGLLGSVAMANPVTTGIALGVLTAGAYAAAAGLKVLADQGSGYHLAAVDDAKRTAENLKTLGPAAENLANYFTHFNERVGSGFDRSIREFSDALVKASAPLLFLFNGTIAKPAGPVAHPYEIKWDDKIPALPNKPGWMDPWDALLKKDKAKPPGTSVHITNNISVTSNQDPDRVARLVMTKIAETYKNPKMSPFAARFDAPAHQ